ncbi:MAG: amidohydrolase [Clostridiales bacterium]|nr:amidohydrolase [Clostridiales bacterium]
MKRIDTLFADVTAVTMDGEPLPHAHVGVTDGTIGYLSQTEPVDTEIGRTVRGSRLVLMPGLINTHTHIAMTALRGYADDAALHTWLFDRIFPAEHKLDARGVYLAARVGMLEAVGTGTTAILDNYFHILSVADAAVETGLRAEVANIAMYFGDGVIPETDRTFSDCRDVMEKYSGHPLVRAGTGIHAVYTSNPETWAYMADYAGTHRLRMQLHLSETAKENADCLEKYGVSPTAALENAGVFALPVTAAHGVHLSAEDRTLLKAHDVTVSHCPASNCKLASGIADVPAMLSAGVNVSLGTDSVASNNSHDLFRELKLAALLGKVRTGDAEALPARTVLAFATANGARAMGYGKSGRIRMGYDADLTLLDFDAPHLTPCWDVCSQLVYAATGRDVCMTMVNGRVVYERGAYPGIDHEKWMAELREYCEKTLR